MKTTVPVLIVHRGARQIGGCCTEIWLGRERLLLDFGANLPGAKGGIPDEKLTGLVFGGGFASREALLLSHPHGDHYGLCGRLPEDLPVFIGSAAKEILKLLAERQDRYRKDKLLPVVERMRAYEAPREIRFFENIRVVPLYADHSAPDSHMFYIEAGGARILFTGDFRDHGVIGEDDRFWRMLTEQVGAGIDLLITEGTTLSREGAGRANAVRSEEELGDRAAELFSRHRYNFVLASSTNLDSIMEFYRHTPPEQNFICDAYQAEVILRGMDGMQKKGPYPLYRASAEHPVLRVVGFGKDRTREDAARLNSLSAKLNVGLGVAAISSKELHDCGFVMLVRGGSRRRKTVFDVMRDKFYPKDGQIVYSMWRGYLEPEHALQPVIDFMGERPFEPLHTSGHAYADAIARLVAAVRPRRIVPIHTDLPERLFDMPKMAPFKDRIRLLEDGEELEILPCKRDIAGRIRR